MNEDRTHGADSAINDDETPGPPGFHYNRDGITLRGVLGDGALSVDVDLLDDEEDMTIQWSVKWDGCVNWQTNPACLAHLCDADGWDRVYRAGKIAVQMALALMGPMADEYGKRGWPDDVEPIDANEGLRDALARCRDQFRFYEREHMAAGKLDKAGTNRTFADLAEAALSLPRSPVAVTAGELWCLHVLGPDEVHPAPDRETAQLWATQWTVFWHQKHPTPRLHDPVMSWVVARWPYDAAAHHAGLAKSLSDNTWPADPLAALVPASAARARIDRGASDALGEMVWSTESAPLAQPRAAMVDGVEAIARIICPEAWQEETANNNTVYRRQVFAEARAEAMTKARQIAALALQSPPAAKVECRAVALVRRIAAREPWQAHYGRTWEEEAADIVAGLPAAQGDAAGPKVKHDTDCAVLYEDGPDECTCQPDLVRETLRWYAERVEQTLASSDTARRELEHDGGRRAYVALASDWSTVTQSLPMSTAPTDGSYFLIIGDQFDGGAAVVMWDAEIRNWLLDDGKNFEIGLRNEGKNVGWLPLPPFIEQNRRDGRG